MRIFKFIVMNKTAQIKKNHQFIKFRKLVIVSILIGFLSAFLGISLKKITEYYEEIFFHEVSVHPLFYIIFPVFGLSVIYFLRQYLFKKKENKGKLTVAAFSWKIASGEWWWRDLIPFVE